MNWYPLLTVPLFIYMGYVFSESGIADDLYKTFHVWFGPVRGGLAIGTIALMVVISAINGLSVAGMAIGATVALPELLKRGYDKIMVTGVVQGGSTLGILVPPSVVLVLYAMIARQPVSELWLAGVGPGLLMAAVFILYIYIRCLIQPELGPALPEEERNVPLAREAPPAARGRPALRHLLRDDRPLPHGHHQPDRVERGRGAGRDARRLVARAADREDAAGRRPPDARHQRDVPLDHPRRALLQRRSSTGSAPGGRSPGSSSRAGGSSPGRSC